MYRLDDEFFKDGAAVDRIILTTGGTGGHIFPALAVAEKIRHTSPDTKMLFVGSLYGAERELAGKAGIDFEGLSVRGIKGRGLKSIWAVMKMLVAVCSALSVLWRFKPQIVIGFGGYASFAPMLAARILGIPVILHEQNAIAGSSNRIMSYLAKQVCVSLPSTKGFPHAEKCVLTGNPVRETIVAAGSVQRNWGARRLLVLGGSQGAHALNAYLPKILPKLREQGIEILHQTGPRDLQATRNSYVECGYAPTCVREFISDMAEAYSWATLVVCRAGASTVAELCAAGLPAVFVPFPGAIHDHQTHNARVMENAGAARIIPESRLEAELSGEYVAELISDSDRLERMGKAAHRSSQRDAAAKLVDIAKNWAKEV